MFAKLSSKSSKVRAMMQKSRNYEKEVRFYQELAPKTNLAIPKCYYGDIDLETGCFILLLEDLSHYCVVNIKDGCSIQNVELVLQSLAEFHANWWEKSEILEIDYITPINYLAEYKQRQYQEWWSKFPEKLENALPDDPLPMSLLELGQQFGSKFANVFAEFSSPPITLLHKDPHVDNLMFGEQEGEQKLVFIDWQLFGYGRSVIDVTYFMIMSVPIDLRRKCEREFLRNYHNLLVQNGVENYAFEQCWVDYQRALFRLLHVLVAVVSVTDISRDYAKNLLKAVMPRLITFIEDHNVKKFL